MSLLERGDDVRVIDTLERDALSLLGIRGEVELIVGSVLDECDCSDVGSVVHLASVAGVPTVIGNPAKTMRVTLAGTLNMLESCRDVRRFVNVSTSEVYGPYAYRADEGSVTSLPPVGESPRWSYATAKLAAEHLCDSYMVEHGVPVVNVRPCNVYGPGQIGVGAVNNFMRAASAGEPLVVYGDGTQIRSWCHVEDFTRLMVAALDAPGAVGQVFNAGNPEAVVTVNELARMVAELTGAEIVRKPRPWPDVEIRVLDVTKAWEVLDWTPFVSLAEGLHRLWRWHLRDSGRG